MVKLSKIKFNEVKPLIELSYKGDESLIKNYPAYVNKTFDGEMTLDDCVNTQMVMIKQCEAEVGDMQYYKALYNDNKIGYAVMFKDVLFSFSINKFFRKPDILKSFFSAICNELPQRFGCVLYKNNEPAVSWLEKCGMVISENEINKNVVTLINI